MLGSISPALDTRLLSSLYSGTVNVGTSNGATTGTGTGTGACGSLVAAVTGDRHEREP